jgi:Cu/Ag efflux protein CusF
MNRIAAVLLALVFPAVLSAAEVEVKAKGTIVKIQKTENRFVLKTERGEETFEVTKATKGVENAKEGARVTVVFSEKDGLPKVSEIRRD